MLFNSWVFILFFVVVYGLYVSCWGLSALAGRRGLRGLGRVLGEGGHRAQNSILLPASMLFYGWWDWRFLILMFVSITTDFWVGRWMHQGRLGGRRKLLLTVSLCVNLGILGFFKYFGFFAESVRAGLATMGWEVNEFALQVVLPVGISFYTFQTLSYTIDVYRRRALPRMSPGATGVVRDYLDFALYISFFPQLVAGPIERATHLLPQVQGARRVGAGDIDAGVWLILWGLFKKIVIADRAALLANEVFNNYQAHSGIDIVVGAVAFAVQIYGDFSAYSDIARGCARLMGFDIMLNFRLPYFALNPSDFWRRWHISLSSWLRDYLYIPLGGNRKGAWRTNVNLLVTMLLGGLWHGAAWNFVIWGAFHGLLLIAYRPFTPRDLDAAPRRGALGWARRGLAMLVMFNFTLIGWVIFRSRSAEQVWEMLSRVGFGTTAGDGARLGTMEMVVPLLWVAGPLLAVQIVQHFTRDLMAPARLPALVKGPVYGFMLAIMAVYGVRESVEFIYFQF